MIDFSGVTKRYGSTTAIDGLSMRVTDNGIYCLLGKNGAGRTGHVWGDQYWSRVLEGVPPEWAEEAVEVAAETGEISFGIWLLDGVSNLMVETPAETGFSPQPPARSPPSPS
jgi:hypothetical protein